MVAGDANAPSCTRDWALIAEHPHAISHFTQGLLITDGRLFESTGLYGHSALQEVDLRSGRSLNRHRLPSTEFAEGLTRVDDRLIQLTWREQRAWIYDLQLQRVGVLRYEGEGWGLTTLPAGGVNSEPRLAMSDGSHRLQFREPRGLELLRTVEVRDGGRAVRNLNELEYVAGEILANVWHRDVVVAIDPDSGTVRGRYDFSALRQRLRWPEAGAPRETDLNGIAYDERSGHALLTGKHWPQLFEVRLGGCANPRSVQADQ